jgi:O-antigen/teichoic acid export membrane protein
VKKALLKNSIYNTLSGVVRITSGVISIPLLINIIGTQEYGVWVIASSLIGVLSIAEAGLSTSTTFFVSQDLSKNDYRSLANVVTINLTLIVILATVISIFIVSGGYYLLANLFKNLSVEEHKTVLECVKLSGIVIWTKLVQQVVIGIEYGFQDYRLANLLIASQTVSMNLGIVAIAFFGGRSIEMMKYQMFISVLFLFLHSGFCSRMLIPKKIHFSWDNKKVKTILKYSFSTWVTNIGGALFSQADKLFVGSALGSHSLGIYAALTTVTSQVNTFSALPVQPLLPKLSELYSTPSRDAKSIESLVKESVVLNCLVSFLLASFMLGFSSHIVQLVLKNDGSHEIVNLFKTSTVIYALYSLNAVGYYACFAMGYATEVMYIVTISGALALGLISILCLKYGLTGAVLGNIVYIMTLILNAKMLNKMGLPSLLWVSWIKYPIVTFSLLIIVNFINFNDLVSQLATLILIFAMIIHFLRSEG